MELVLRGLYTGARGQLPTGIRHYRSSTLSYPPPPPSSPICGVYVWDTISVYTQSLHIFVTALSVHTYL